MRRLLVAVLVALPLSAANSGSLTTSGPTVTFVQGNNSIDGFTKVFLESDSHVLVIGPFNQLTGAVTSSTGKPRLPANANSISVPDSSDLFTVDGNGVQLPTRHLDSAP